MLDGTAVRASAFEASRCGSDVIVAVGPLPPPVTGESVAFESLVKALRNRGTSVEVVRLPSQSAEPLRLWIEMLHYFKPVLAYCRALFRNPKAVYLTMAQSPKGFLRDFFVIWLAWLSGRRVVCHLHGGNYDGFYNARPPWFRFLVRVTLRRISRILVLSDRLRGTFAFDPELTARLRVVPNGYAGALPASVPKRLPADGDSIRLLYLSNLVESKGYLDVVEAVAILVKKHRFDVTCDFAGEFRCAPDDVRVRNTKQAMTLFNERVVTHGLQDRIRYHGAVFGRDKTRLLEGAHIFVLPTDYSNEGQPVSILEAMAYGVVPVCTDFRAIPDMVVNGKTGALAPYGDPGGLANVIASILRRPAHYTQLSAEAVRHCRLNFSYDLHLKRILPVLFDCGNDGL